MMRMNPERGLLLTAPLFPFALLLILFASCGRTYKIEGSSSITSLDGKLLSLRMLQGEEWVTVDSAEVIHGLFKMGGPADSIRMVTLYMNQEAIMPLVLEKGKITVSISNSQLTAQGTPLNDRLYEFIGKRNEMEVRIEEIERKEARMVLDGADIEEIHDQLVKEEEDLVKEMQDYVKQFIIDNFENVLGPSVFRMMCSTLPYPVMTPQIEDIMRTAPQQFKEDAFVKDFLVKAKENMQLIEEQQRMQENAALPR